MQAQRGTGLTEARATEIRVGSSTNGVVPVLGARRSLAARTRQWVELGAVAFAAIAADQLTKRIVSSQLALGEEVDVVGPLSIHHVQNSGIAFGIFSTWASAVTILTAIAIAWMVGYFAKAGARHPILPVALGFLIGGSLGNLVDRVRLGHVTDFLDVSFWPAFNLADTFIVLGVVILMATIISAERSPRKLHRRLPRTSG